MKRSPPKALAKKAHGVLHVRGPLHLLAVLVINDAQFLSDGPGSTASTFFELARELRLHSQGLIAPGTPHWSRKKKGEMNDGAGEREEGMDVLHLLELLLWGRIPVGVLL